MGDQDQTNLRGTRIELARQADFRCGTLAVLPATRELVRDDGEKEVVEPRVMQVLVALARANGAVVSRNELTESCWEGRVVGEDAINRVLSRLRRLTDGIARDCFRVETVTKVGYRLISNSPTTLGSGALSGSDGLAGSLEALPAPSTSTSVDGRSSAHLQPASRPLRRRWLIGGIAAVGATAMIGADWWWMRHSANKPPIDIAELIAQARLAIVQLDRSSSAQAVGLLRRAVEIEPTYADGWGQLAYAYVMAGKFSAPEKQVYANDRAKAAAERAQSLDPGNPYARLAMALMRPAIGNWLTLERITRDGLARHPDDELMLLYLSGTYTWTGRCRESAAILAAVKAKDPPGPGPMTSLVIELWGSDQLEEADRVMDEAFRLFPLTTWVWVTRFWLLTYTGRADQALTMVGDADSRPSDIRPEIASILDVTAKAVLSRSSSDVEAALTINLAAAKVNSSGCVSAIRFCSVIGQLDEAFTLLDALFFGKPFEIGASGPKVQVGAVKVRADQQIMDFFTPPFAALRGDPRFKTFCDMIGLSRYWRESGSVPDYLRKTAS